MKIRIAPDVDPRTVTPLEFAVMAAQMDAATEHEVWRNKGVWSPRLIKSIGLSIREFLFYARSA